MLELSCAGQVFRDSRPPIVPVGGAWAAQSNHRLNGECHSRPHECCGQRVIHVWNLQTRLKNIADSMAAIVADNPHALGVGIGLDGLSDGSNRKAWFHGADALPEGLMGDADEVCRLFVDGAHGEGGIGVAMHAMEEEGDVNVEDVSVLERATVRDAMTDDFVGRGADGFGEAAIIECAWIAAEGDDGFMRKEVQLVGGHSGANGLAGEFQNLGRGLAGFAKSGKLLRVENFVHIAQLGATAVGIVRRGNMRRDSALLADFPGLNARGLIAFSFLAQFSVVGFFVAALILKTAFAPAQVIWPGMKAHGCFARRRRHGRVFKFLPRNATKAEGENSHPVHSSNKLEAAFSRGQQALQGFCARILRSLRMRQKLQKTASALT